MSSVADFRLSRFDSKSIDECGIYVGHRTYWKLYAIENVLRVIIHSILSAQILSLDWWGVAVDSTMRRDAEDRRKRYQKKTGHKAPNFHGIYYVYLRDLNEIMRANANLFDPVIPDLDKWLIGIEELGSPRNVVAHMNFPDKSETRRIDTFYDDCQNLVSQVRGRIDLKIP